MRYELLVLAYSFNIHNNLKSCFLDFYLKLRLLYFKLLVLHYSNVNN